MVGKGGVKEDFIVFSQGLSFGAVGVHWDVAWAGGWAGG